MCIYIFKQTNPPLYTPMSQNSLSSVIPQAPSVSPSASQSTFTTAARERGSGQLLQLHDDTYPSDPNYTMSVFQQDSDTVSSLTLTGKSRDIASVNLLTPGIKDTVDGIMDELLDELELSYPQGKEEFSCFSYDKLNLELTKLSLICCFLHEIP